jgi:hypothetical protein
MLAVLAALTVSPSSAEQPWRWSGVPRVVVVADIHGAYDQLVELLQATAIVDGSLRWSGGDAHLVSLGDLLDRGPQSRQVMDLLMRLQREAPLRGGEVHVLLGNHEVMNLTGDVRYVSVAEYAAFIADEPPALRASALEQFRSQQPVALSEQELRRAFEQRYPPGYFAHRRAFAASGAYGAWLLSLPSLIVIDRTAFVHGGLPSVVAEVPAGELNQRNQDDLRRYLAELAGPPAPGEARPPAAPEPTRRAEDPSRDGESAAPIDARGLGVDGPLWYRGSVYCKPILEEPVLAAALARLDAARVVVGHTPTEDRRVHELHDGRLIMLDTGMLSDYYAGRPAALIIENGQALVQYLGPPERARPEPGRSLSLGLTEPEIMAALTAGEVLAVEADRTSGRFQVQLRSGEHALRAIFYEQDRARAADHELAAYRLDRLLGLGLVPPTVSRRIRDREGAVQFLPPDVVSESARVERRLGLASWCPLGPQAQLLYAFDALTANAGRTGDTILYRPELPDLMLIDHGRAFGATHDLPAGLRSDALTLTPSLVAGLTELNERALETELGTLLSGAQIRALLARRDALLERFER